MTTSPKQPRAPRKPRTPKTAQALADVIKAKEQELLKLQQQKAYLVVADKIKNSKLVSEFKKLQGELGDAVTEVGLLAAVGKELGIKRLSVTQSEPVKRARRGTGSKAAVKKRLSAEGS